MKLSDGIILDKSWIKEQIQIEEMEQGGSPTQSRAARIRTLKQILEKSKPLLPYTQKVFKEAQVIFDDNFSFVSGLDIEKNNIAKKEFLKKDI